VNSLRGFFRFLAIALPLAGTGMIAGCKADGDRPGTIILPGMVESIPMDAYDSNPAAHSHPAVLAPPDGTVSLEASPFLYGPGVEEAKRAGRELANPLAPTPENLARGKQVFETICQVCHGMKGEGDGPIIGGPGRFPNPPSLLAPRAKGLPDGQIFHIVSRGQGIMPSHAAQVLATDRWKVIRYLRQLQGTDRLPVLAAADFVSGAANQGVKP